MVSNDTRKTVALYARVSTLDQDCNVQLADLRRYAQQRFARYCEYVDVGVSGAQRRRPQLDALMTAAGQRQFDVVLRIESGASRSQPHHAGRKRIAQDLKWRAGEKTRKCVAVGRARGGARTQVQKRIVAAPEDEISGAAQLVLIIDSEPENMAALHPHDFLVGIPPNRH